MEPDEEQAQNPDGSPDSSSDESPEQEELESDADQEKKPDESPDPSSDESLEQEVFEPDEEQEQKPDESPEQDKKVLEPENSGDFIELELCEDAEDSTTAKEQEDEALPTRRRKRKMNSMPKSEPKRTRDVPIEITFSEESSSWFRSVTSDITADLTGLLRMYEENSDIGKLRDDVEKDYEH